jgi:hypothetical protein
VVCDQESSKNDEAKARYWAVKIQPQWVVTPGKQTNKQLNREVSTKLIQKNSFTSTAHEPQFSEKQKFHGAPKQRHSASGEISSN